ncbi:ficolin-2-like [Uranotaenia lowii]|uniref:ficolin-2-like n=1 Tax=Uranotaenia lowii TaxID=190385 RepID=UPI00247AB583|nr:ficolin-2-like [Uranotaenia lowii]
MFAKRTTIPFLVLSAFGCCNAIENPISPNVSSTSYFAQELFLAALDAINFNLQNEHFRSRENHQKYRTEIADLWRTLTQTQELVAKQVKTLAKLQTDIEIMILNVSVLLGDTRQITRTLEVLPTTEMINDLILKQRVGKICTISTPDIAQTCSEVPKLLSGINRLLPQRGFQESFEALCDQDYENGGWTVIQNRFNGSVDFYRGWKAYEEGFGDLRGEFWLGLKRIHQLTSSMRHELHVLLEDFEGKSVVAKYDDFRVADEAEKYTLESLGQYSGTAGDSLSYSLGKKFSTLDADNDSFGTTNCAVAKTGAWWYGSCSESNLNGQYLGHGAKDNGAGMNWWYFHGSWISLKISRMMIRVKA